MASVPPSTGELRPFCYRVLLAASVVVGLLLLVLLAWYAVQVLLMAFAGVLLAILLRALSDWLAAKTRLSDGWALAVVIVALLGLGIGVTLLSAPAIGHQLQQLQEQLPQALQEARRGLAQLPAGEALMRLVPRINDEGGREMILQMTGLAYTAVQAFFSVFVVAFLTLYLAVNPKLYISGLLHMVPRPQRQRTAQVLGSIGFTLRWWLIGTLIRMAAVGVMTFVGLWLLDIPLALILALLVGLLDFVPYFGPILAAVPAVLIGFAVGPEQGIYVVLLYVVVQQIESFVITPIVYERTVYLPPVLTILAQVLLWILAGALGVLLATPLMAVVLVVVKMLYVEQTLGDFGIGQPERELHYEDLPDLPGQDEAGPVRRTPK